MKITIEIPDWAEERHLYIMAGIELLAYKMYGENSIHVKQVRCNSCGECCKGLPKIGHVPVDEYGTCVHLTKDGCGLGIERPYTCNITDPVKGKRTQFDKCCITYKEEVL